MAHLVLWVINLRKLKLSVERESEFLWDDQREKNENIYLGQLHSHQHNCISSYIPPCMQS